MRARWEEIRVSLADSVITIETELEFREAKEEAPALARFEDPTDLLSFLTSREGDLDEKDEILRFLVRAIQTGAGWADLAKSLLFLGLWPGLDGVFRKNFRFFAREPDELAAQLCALMSLQFHRADLSRVHRIAATLLLNANRDLRRKRSRTWAEDLRSTDLPPDDLFDTDQPVADSWHSRSGSSEDDPLRGWLRAEVGPDASLVEDVAIHGETQKEAGARRGLTHVAARKRYQRALGRLSHSLRQGGVSRGKGATRR